MSSNIFVEAVAVGLAVLVLGLVIWFAAKCFFPKTNLNSLYSHAVILFILGFTLHLSSEYLGINAWYCKKGVACKR